MTNSRCTVLDCSDTPLTIASSFTGFVTTFVALMFSYHASWQRMQSAPRVGASFQEDILAFAHSIQNLAEEFGREAQRDAAMRQVGEQNPLLLTVDLELDRDQRTLTEAATVL